MLNFINRAVEQTIKSSLGITDYLPQIVPLVEIATINSQPFSIIRLKVLFLAPNPIDLICGFKGPSEFYSLANIHKAF